jgi:ABC-type uncharacterized transport system ATPase subunit
MTGDILSGSEILGQISGNLDIFKFEIAEPNLHEIFIDVVQKQEVK